MLDFILSCYHIDILQTDAKLILAKKLLPGFHFYYMYNQWQYLDPISLRVIISILINIKQVKKIHYFFIFSIWFTYICLPEKCSDTNNL